MNASGILSLSLTGLAVKTYMLIAVIWSKSDQLYHELNRTPENQPALHPASK